MQNEPQIQNLSCGPHGRTDLGRHVVCSHPPQCLHRLWAGISRSCHEPLPRLQSHQPRQPRWSRLRPGRRLHRRLHFCLGLPPHQPLSHPTNHQPTFASKVSGC